MASFQIKNPLGDGVDDLGAIFNVFSSNLMKLVIPVAVLMYVWAGVQFLIAAGRPAYVTKGKEIFMYTTVGLLVIFIGEGFVDLIISILNASK